MRQARGDNGGVSQHPATTDDRDRHQRSPLAQANSEPTSWAFPLMGRVLCGSLALVARRHWRGREHLPTSGPAILVSNHLTSLDAAFLGEYVGYAGRWPYFLAKASLFRVPGLGLVLRRAGIIPVHRGTAQAADALVKAREHLALGRLIVMFPEGTTTYDPELWPMTPRTGAARLALGTGVPVLPVGLWGTSTIVPDNGGPQRLPHLIPRHDVTVELGPPLDLSAFGRDAEDQAAVLAASQAIIAAITSIVAGLRGQTPPPGRWDMRLKRRLLPGEAGII